MLKEFPKSYVLVCDNLGCETCGNLSHSWEEALAIACKVNGFKRTRDESGRVRYYCLKCFPTVRSEREGICQKPDCEEIIDTIESGYCKNHDPDLRCKFVECETRRIDGLDYCLLHAKSLLKPQSEILRKTQTDLAYRTRMERLEGK